METKKVIWMLGIAVLLYGLGLFPGFCEKALAKSHGSRTELLMGWDDDSSDNFRSHRPSHSDHFTRGE